MRHVNEGSHLPMYGYRHTLPRPDSKEEKQSIETDLDFSYPRNNQSRKGWIQSVDPIPRVEVPRHDSLVFARRFEKHPLERDLCWRELPPMVAAACFAMDSVFAIDPTWSEWREMSTIRLLLYWVLISLSLFLLLASHQCFQSKSTSISPRDILFENSTQCIYTESILCEFLINIITTWLRINGRGAVPEQLLTCWSFTLLKAWYSVRLISSSR